ncbi:DinB family protein, partial [Candidatus Bipolaricaulota bacterium]|nr:DinB family protein [Candidatus Bipolaricaulota bacterium]
AYWEYAVRRSLEGGPKGAFPRSPSNWPLLPEECNERTWASDRQLVKQEREALIRAVECFPAEKLAEPTSGMSDRTYEELLIGIIQHSAYHTGQIALLKRLEGPG